MLVLVVDVDNSNSSRAAPTWYPLPLGLGRLLIPVCRILADAVLDKFVVADHPPPLLHPPLRLPRRHVPLPLRAQLAVPPAARSHLIAALTRAASNRAVPHLAALHRALSPAASIRAADAVTTADMAVATARRDIDVITIVVIASAASSHHHPSLGVQAHSSEDPSEVDSRKVES